MELNRRLKEIPRNKKGEFLRKKLRELKLLYKIDKFTDDCKDLSSLIERTLKFSRRFFNCRIAALLFTDREARHREFYLAMGLEDDSSRAGRVIAIKEYLHAMISSEGKSEIVNDPQPENSMALKNYFAASFRVSDRLSAAIIIAVREISFADEDLHYLKAIISQIDNGLEHAYLRHKYQRSRRRIKKEAKKLDFVYEISLSLGREEDFVSLCKRILESSMQLVEVNRCSFMTYDPDKDELKTEFAIGIPFKKSQIVLKLGEGVAGAALKEKRAILAAKGNTDVRFVPFSDAPQHEFPGILNLACLPLYVDGYPFGVLNFSSSDPKYSVTPSELSALEVVSQLITLAWEKQKLYHLSIKDELTGLYSFRFFKQRLQEEIVRLGRQEADLSIILFDIDFFKKFNDNYGHLAGNQVLKTFANILRTSGRQGVDLPARFGGEEFSMILPGTPATGAILIAERIRKATEAAVETFEGKPLKITVSGGIKQFEADLPLDDFIHQADQALYEAKESGRNRIKVFSKI